MTQQTYTPDWSKAPPQANWWARDKDGSGFWYSKRPSARRHSFIAYGCFVAADNDCPFIDCSFELDNWRDTLTVRPFQDRDIPENLSDYFSGKTPFITAYVDLLLARMAKEGRFSDGEKDIDDFKPQDIVKIEDDDSFSYAVWNSNSPKIYQGYAFIVTQNNSKWLSQSHNAYANALISIFFFFFSEAAEFRKVMVAVYG